jgi:hypothetical protein
MNRYDHTRWLCVAMLMAAPLPLLAQQTEPVDHPPVTANVHELANETTTVTATVIHVDQQSRFVTLRGPKGNEITVEAGPDVRNLAQLKAGDQITVRYQQALAVEILPASSGDQPGAVVEGSASRADKGMKPGGNAEQAVTVTTTLTAIDLKNHTVTLKGPEGNERTIAVKDPARQAKLAKLKVGDLVRITYVEAVALQVTPENKGSAKP